MEEKEKINLKIVSYRFCELVLWFIFLCINIPYLFIIAIPFLITGKEYIEENIITKTFMKIKKYIHTKLILEK